MSKYTSNNDIYYFPLWSLPDLVDHYNAVVYNYFLTSSNIIVPVSDIPDMLTVHYFLYNGKCPLYFPSQFISWFLLLPYDYALLPVECQITGDNASSPVSICNLNTVCVVRDIIIYVRGVLSSIHEDIFMSMHRIYHFLCNCAVMNGCSGHFPLP